MTIKNKIIITQKESGLRLDKFLVEKKKDYSRSFWQKAIKDNLVLVNGEATSSHYKTKEDDKIEIKQREVKKIIKEKKIDLSPDKKIKFEIIFEDDNFLVINKPVGLTVHPSDGTPKGTLANGLLAYLPKLKDVGDDELRPGIVHRLDKDVSGLMVITKNQRAFLHLKEQFKSRKVKKTYRALVYGVINKDYDEINLKIGRSKTTGIMATGGDNYKEAKTLFWVKKRFRNYSYLKVKILTGRTHQIRVHLRAIDHPVVGDKMYYLKKYNNIRDFNLNRNFLHSYKLGFKNMDGEWLEFKNELPAELANILKEIDIIYE
jgi:23S rRNA pseudouridine1911/1915/1917 synthase